MLDLKRITRMHTAALILRDALRKTYAETKEDGDASTSTSLCIAWIKIDDALKMIGDVRRAVEDAQFDAVSTESLIAMLPAADDEETKKA